MYPSSPASSDNSHQWNARETGSISSATQQRQLHFPFPGIQPSGEPEVFEQAHSRGAFQNMEGFHMVKVQR